MKSGGELTSSIEPRPMFLLSSILAEKGFTPPQRSERTLEIAVHTRMKDTGTDDPNEYVRYLTQNPSEYENLLALLFSDHNGPQCENKIYKLLEETVIPLLILNRSLTGRAKLRVWIRGADRYIIPYRVAILFRELLGETCDSFSIEILCTSGKAGGVHLDKDSVIDRSDLILLDKEREDRYFRSDGDILHPATALTNMAKMIDFDPSLGPWPKDVDLMVCFEDLASLPKALREGRIRTAIGSLNEGGFLLLSDERMGGTKIPGQLNPVARWPGFFQKTSPNIAKYLL